MTMLIVNDRTAIPLEEFRIEFARSGGPGGQNVNKVASKAVVRWRPAASPSLPGPVRDRLLRLLSARLTGAASVGSRRPGPGGGPSPGSPPRSVPGPGSAAR